VSAWKIAIRRLYELDGLATSSQITEHIKGRANVYWPVERLRQLGLIEPATGHGRNQVCRITPLGRAFVEGRAEVVKEAVHFRTGRRPEVVRMVEGAK
jgi:hypothetical protein